MFRYGKATVSVLLALGWTLSAQAGGASPAPAPKEKTAYTVLVSLPVSTRLKVSAEADQRYFAREIPPPPQAPKGTPPKIEYLPEDLSSLIAEAQMTLRQIEKFCEAYHLPYESAPDLHIHISAEPPTWNGTPHAGLIDSQEKKVWIYRFAPDGVARPLFHELAHWLHFTALHQRSQDLHGLEPWIQEAIPHLASILFMPQGSLSFAETRFLQTRLSGSIRLQKIEDSTPQWFGLVGLWTRYLGHLYNDPRAILSHWLELNPGETPRFDFDFVEENARPAPAWSKKIENLFSMFALALHANLNRGEFEPWGLYSLGLPSSGSVTPTSDNRVQNLRPNDCVTLRPMEFRYVWAGALSDADRIEQSPGIRALLWTGRRKPDLLSRSPKDLSFFAWDRILIVNSNETGSESGHFCPMKGSRP